MSLNTMKSSVPSGDLEEILDEPSDQIWCEIEVFELIIQELARSVEFASIIDEELVEHLFVFVENSKAKIRRTLDTKISDFASQNYESSEFAELCLRIARFRKTLSAKSYCSRVLRSAKSSRIRTLKIFEFV
ncbi:hypothetical protein L6452_18609 [Arctium lappa]|uniref:Uncharacterized protein n=1 Tax=Arctium lappa TaxID=4217 RepID=A0ACB9C6Q2_ARCLA|nr:hypothetical protein L6452_18609 [Arctium lappa]